MVANLLDWKQVSGSGSRPFHVGDVVSKEWLGECKTHTTITDKITFKSSVWNKIRIESKSCNRFAVYFSDNGSQLAKYTLCVISYNANPFNLDNIVIHHEINATKSGNIILNVDDFKLFDGICISSLDQESVLVMPLTKFSELLG